MDLVAYVEARTADGMDSWAVFLVLAALSLLVLWVFAELTSGGES